MLHHMRVICTLITIQLLLIDALPNCTITKRVYFCTPGDDDFVLGRGLVSDNNKITGITLKACRITKIVNEAFADLPALEYLDLSYNKIAKLDLGTFDGFQQLLVLNLAYNQITTFPLGIFDSKINLQIINLKGNMINNIEYGVLNPLKKLRHLDLSSNDLLGRHMNVDIFYENHLINFMDFSGNDMSGTKDTLLKEFTLIDFLNLDRCSLTEVPSFATKPNLKTMKHLMLSTNSISKLDSPNTFEHLENLEILNLVDNNIESVVEGVFRPLKNLKTLLLANNKLSQIPDTLFKNMPMLHSLDLSNNTVEFIPVNAFRGSLIKTLNLAGNKFTYLTDNFCLELKNAGGKLSEFYFQQNPWQCPCLRDLIDEVKRLEIKYSDIDFAGTEPVCVISNDFNCRRQPDANSYFIDLYNKRVLQKT